MTGTTLRRMRPWLGTYVSIEACAADATHAALAIEAAFVEIATIHAAMSFHSATSELAQVEAAMAALRAGQIHALCHSDPIIAQAEQKHGLRVVVDARTIKASHELFGGTMPASCLYAAQPFVQKRTDQVQALTSAGVAALTTTQVGALSTDQVVALTSAQVASLTTAQIATLSSAQVASIETGDVAVLKSTQLLALKTTQVQALTTEQVQALTTAGIAALSTAQAASLTTDQVVALTSTQVGAMTTAQVAALTAAQIAVIETDDIAVLKTAQVAALKTTQIQALTTDQVVALSTDQAQTLSAAQVASLTTAQIAAIETADLAVLKTTQIVGSVSPAAVSRRRRNSWPDKAAALEYFRHKKVFARWDPRRCILAGLLFGLVAWRCASIWPALALHVSLNLAEQARFVAAGALAPGATVAEGWLAIAPTFAGVGLALLGAWRFMPRAGPAGKA